MAETQKTRTTANAPKVKTLKQRQKAIQICVARAWVDIDEPEKLSKELRQWIRLSHEVSERAEQYAENEKMIKVLAEYKELRRQMVAGAGADADSSRAEARGEASPEGDPKCH